MNQFSNKEEVEGKAVAHNWAQFQPCANGCLYITPEGNVLFVAYDVGTGKVINVGNVMVKQEWLRTKI